CLPAASWKRPPNGLFREYGAAASRARTRADRCRLWAWFVRGVCSRAPPCLDVARRLRVDDHLEAAVDHAFAVERHLHGAGLRFEFLHHLRHGLVAHGPRRPQDPRETDGLVVATLDGHREGGHLAVRHVVAPALDELQGAVLPEQARRLLGVLAVDLAVGGGYRDNKSVDVAHGSFSFALNAASSAAMSIFTIFIMAS